MKIARRHRIDKFTASEQAIWAAKQLIEQAGAHPLLTDATNLLSRAQEKVADYIDLTEA